MINLEKIKPTNATVIFLCVFNVFIFAFAVFLLSGSLFFSLNLWQIIVISVGLSGAFLFTNLIVFSINNWPRLPQVDARDPMQAEKAQAALWATTGLLTDFVILISLLISYLIDFGLRQMILLTFAMDFLLIVFLIWEKNKEIKQKGKLRKQMEELDKKLAAYKNSYPESPLNTSQ
jgi:glucan phosphoethanolaminetransferase (alkaline phosphatase superfamily)